MIRSFLSVALVFAATTSPANAEGNANPEPRPQPGQTRTAYQPLTGMERVDFYIEDTYANPGVFFRLAMPSLFNTIDNEPPEWGDGAGGFGRRAADRLGQQAVQGSVEHGLAALLKTEPRYIPCECSGFFKRFGYAALSGLWTYTNNGNKTVHLPSIAGGYAGGMATLAWYPDRFSWKDGLRTGTQQLAFSGVGNIFREFKPELMKLLPFTGK